MNEKLRKELVELERNTVVLCEEIRELKSQMQNINLSSESKFLLQSRIEFKTTIVESNNELISKFKK